MRTLRSTFLIAEREFGSYFLQPLAWVVLTALWAFMGLAFWLVLSMFSVYPAPAIELQRELFRSMLFWLPLLVALPVLAMRLLAEERQSGTLENLLTAPITESAVVAGKFAAALSFFLVIISPFALYLGILGYYGELDLAAAFAGLLGMILTGALLLAASLAASALVRNQIVAAIVGFVTVLVLYIGPLFAGQLAPSGPGSAVWEYLNLWMLLDAFSRGIIDSQHLVYPLSGTVFFLFLAARLLESSKGK